MDRYIYKCFDCNTQFSSTEIEKNFFYLCPKCGKAEKRQPLKGVLQIEYDYAEIKKKLNKYDFIQLPAGQFWLYPELWPLSYYEDFGNYSINNINLQLLQRLNLNRANLLTYEVDDKIIQFFDDTHNPTLSYKDRATSLVALKAIQFGINEIAAASTGNAGSSLAGICSMLGLKSHLFVPKNIPKNKRLQIQAYGSQIYIVDGDYDLAFDLSLEISRSKNWYNRNTAYNPLTIEGKKSAAYDIFITTKGELPDIIFVPVGDGVIISGLYKGFWEMLQLGWIDKLPQLVAVQAEGSNALIRYLESNKFEFQNTSSIADSICAGAPRNLYMAVNAVRTSKGKTVSVSDNEIIEAQAQLAGTMGQLVEPASAAGYAGYKKLLYEDKINDNERALILLTGHGIKDVKALKQWNEEPKIKTYSEWQKYFDL